MQQLCYLHNILTLRLRYNDQEIKLCGFARWLQVKCSEELLKFELLPKEDATLRKSNHHRQFLQLAFYVEIENEEF